MRARPQLVCSALACLLLAACASNLHRSTATVTDARVPASSGSDDVVFRALGLVGTPYRYGGNTPDGGFDCSGFVSFVYADAAGVALPHNTEELSRVGKAELDPNAVGSGDVVLFSEDDDSVATSHVGIYVGGGRFVHAPKTGGTVRLDDLNQPYWHARFLGARRVLD